MNGGRALVSQRRMHCMYSGMAKGTSQAEVTSSSKKIKPIAFTIVELCNSIRQLVENSIIFLKFHSNFLKAFQINLKACLGLTIAI